MTLPSDRPIDTGVRGPAGTEAMGVSVAIPHEKTQGWGQRDWQDAIAEYQPQMLEALRRHVGGAKPATEPSLHVDGPHSDPLQGLIYVMTASAWFSPASLPVGCTAYQARSQRRG